MFNLDYEVEEWSKEFAGTKCGRADRVQELNDHLYCEIEKNIEEGLNEESAFLAATRRFGISDDLKKQFRKGKGITSLLCDAEAELHAIGKSPKKVAFATVIYLSIFAALTFGMAIYLQGTNSFPYATPILYVLSILPVLFALFFAERSRAECSFVKRMWRKVN